MAQWLKSYFRYLVAVQIAFHFALFGLSLDQKVEAYVSLKDPRSACRVVEEGLDREPASELLLKKRIKVLAEMGDEKRALAAWRAYKDAFPSKAMDTDLTECMAWGVLKKGVASPLLQCRATALLAAHFSSDVKGASLLLEGMQSSNYAIRALAVRLAVAMRDRELIDQIKNLWKQERSWLVRKELIAAIGKMHISELSSELKVSIASHATSDEERGAAIRAFLCFLKNPEHEAILPFALSKRAGLRLLYCQACCEYQVLSAIPHLEILTADPHPDVRMAAFQALGFLHPQTEEVVNYARKGVCDPHYKVSISAGWLLTLYAPEEGRRYLCAHLLGEKADARLMAASAVRAAGLYGCPLAEQFFQQHADPYVRLNLALVLMGLRLKVEESASILEEAIVGIQERWEERHWGILEGIASRRSQNQTELLEEPEAEDQLLRLKLLNFLAIVRSPGASKAIQTYLNERIWGISATAAALLLMEGESWELDLVSGLLQDQNPKVRLQAALVLSLWSHHEEAIAHLKSAYPSSDYQTKMRILEGMVRIGSLETLPFFMDVLQDPSQTLRTLGALGIIHSLQEG